MKNQTSLRSAVPAFAWLSSPAAMMFIAGWTGLAEANFHEDFTNDPLLRGWKVFGETNLFVWNPAEQNLEVTWNTEVKNSYFYWPFATALNKSDDFSVSLDLVLESLELNHDQFYAFEIAFGFIRMQDATSPQFNRSTGRDSPNLVEFDYFPDTGFGATISPAVVSSNGQFAASFTFPLELTLDDLYQIEARYDATVQTFYVQMNRNGEPSEPVNPVKLGDQFTGFHVDAFAISSYQDFSERGSILAHGTIDNIRLNLPNPPIQTISGKFRDDDWEISFHSSRGWSYQLQSSDDLSNWSNSSPPIMGTGEILTVLDPKPGAAVRYYRVKAERTGGILDL